MLLDNSSQIFVKSIEPSASVKGTPYGKVTQGVSDFKNLIFVGEPGIKNIKFEAYSKAIDIQKLDIQYSDGNIENFIDVSFRFCQPGEIIELGECKT
jgi:hypothetical protein